MSILFIHYRCLVGIAAACVLRPSREISMSWTIAQIIEGSYGIYVLKCDRCDYTTSLIRRAYAHDREHK